MPADKLCPDVWLLQSKFCFFGLFEIGLNGLVLRLNRGGRPALALVNPPKMTSEVASQLREIEQEAGAKVEVIVQPGDWHHFQLPAAQKAFPEAKLYVASERNLRKQPKLNGTVCDRVAPAIPELGDDVELIPWLGFTQDGMPWLMSGEKKGAHRIEFVLVHRPSGTVFITDHMLALKAGEPIKTNTGGFKLADAAAARQSAQRVTGVATQRVVFSHGPRTACLLGAGAKEVLAEAYKALLLAHKA